MALKTNSGYYYSPIHWILVLILHSKINDERDDDEVELRAEIDILQLN